MIHDDIEDGDAIRSVELARGLWEAGLVQLHPLHDELSCLHLLDRGQPGEEHALDGIAACVARGGNELARVTATAERHRLRLHLDRHRLLQSDDASGRVVCRVVVGGRDEHQPPLGPLGDRHPRAQHLGDLSLREEAIGDATLVHDLERAGVQAASAKSGKVLVVPPFDDRDIDARLYAVPILLGASTIIFFLMHAAPGDPTSIYLGNPNIDPRVIEQKLLSFLPVAERPESTEKAA